MIARNQEIKKSRNHRGTRRFFGGVAFLLSCFLVFVVAVYAANIDTTPNDHWAWNDVIGWLDFIDVTIGNPQLQGSAHTSSVGDIALDCATSPNGNVCATSNFSVVNDGYGNLSGYGWNDQIGWVSFWCGNVAPGDCAVANYRVTVDGNGDFSGWAWNDAVGYISFNCSNTGTCGISNYKVGTSWVPGQPYTTGNLTSSIFDAGAPVALNSITWRGTLNGLSSNAVRFRIASSNCPNGKTNPPSCNDAGTWRFLGPSGSSTDYYIPTGPNAPMGITTSDHNNVRYFRYYVYMESDVLGTISPQIDDVVINWSP